MPAIEKPTTLDPLEEAESLKEESFLSLKDLFEHSGSSLGELLKTLTTLIPAFGGPDVDDPASFTDQQVDLKAGECRAEGRPVTDTGSVEEAVGGEDLPGTLVDSEKPVIREPDGTLWTESDCPSIIVYIKDLMQALESNEVSDVDKVKLKERLDFFLSAKVTLKCEGDYPVLEGESF